MGLNRLAKMKEVWSNFLPDTLLSCAVVVFFLPFVVLMFFAAPSEDDFARAALAPQTLNGFRCPSGVGSLAVAWAQYANMDAGQKTASGSGRWVTSLLQTTVMHNVGFSGSYGWLLLLVALTNVCALAYFLKNLLDISGARALLVGGVLYAAWLASFSPISESLYWFTGAVEYQLPISGLLVLGGLLCKSRHSVYGYVAMAILAIAVPAEHEIAGSFLVVCLFGGLMVAAVLRKPLRPWLLCLALAGLSFAAIMLSPAMAMKLTIGHVRSSERFISHLPSVR